MSASREAEISEIAGRFPEGDRSFVTSFLRAVQQQYNWLPPESLHEACERFKVSYPRVYEEASLSPEFCLEPRGEIVIAVCRGMACSEAHARDVLKDWETALGLKEGESSPDNKFTLCTQNCFGRCAIGPNVRVGKDLRSGQRPGDAVALLKTFH